MINKVDYYFFYVFKLYTLGLNVLLKIIKKHQLLDEKERKKNTSSCYQKLQKPFE